MRPGQLHGAEVIVVVVEKAERGYSMLGVGASG